MSIITPIKHTVQVYKSTDTGAPPLTQTGAAGEIKTILKGCLSAGYGSVLPATGWTMPFEDVNRAVFQSTDPQAPGDVLYIDDNAATTATVKAYTAMTDIDTGTGLWADNNTSLYSTHNSDWILFATPVAFLLLALCQNSSNETVAMPLYFGAVSNVGVTDNGLCALHHPTTSGSGGASLTQPFTTGIRKFSDAQDYHVACVDNALTTPSAYGNLAFPMYLSQAGDIRAGLPLFREQAKTANVKEAITVAGRSVYRVSVGTQNHVLQIPTDYWLI